MRQVLPPVHGREVAGKDMGESSEEEIFFQDKIESVEKKNHHSSLKMYRGLILYFDAINFYFSGVCECKSMCMEGQGVN